MDKKIQGETFLETLIAMIIILIVINPLFSSLIKIKKNQNRLFEYKEIENEMEKIRVFYKKNGRFSNYNLNGKKYILKVEHQKIYEDIYKINIYIEKNKIKRESCLYVYEQK